MLNASTINPKHLIDQQLKTLILEFESNNEIDFINLVKFRYQNSRRTKIESNLEILGRIVGEELACTSDGERWVEGVASRC